MILMKNNNLEFGLLAQNIHLCFAIADNCSKINYKQNQEWIHYSQKLKKRLTNLLDKQFFGQQIQQISTINNQLSNLNQQLENAHIFLQQYDTTLQTLMQLDTDLGLLTDLLEQDVTTDELIEVSEIVDTDPIKGFLGTDPIKPIQSSDRIRAYQNLVIVKTQERMQQDEVQAFIPPYAKTLFSQTSEDMLKNLMTIEILLGG
jgi:glutaredoxin 2